MTTLQDVQAWRGMPAVDSNGDKVGKIEDIYLDRSSGEPEWATVSTGLFGRKTSFVPIQSAGMSEGCVRLAHPKDMIKDAPSIDPDGELSTAEEQRLYEHYGRGDYGGWSGEDRTSGDAMTRSEEELHVGTERKEAGRARLRKHVVTEEVEKTVPVQREELRVEREPITDENIDDAMSGPDISEGEHEVTLHAEEPVVEKRAVPKERVRLDKDTVTDEQTVSGEVRRERIEQDGDDVAS
jgi:uncharacterized protein (TIGR02271 family)